MNRPRAAVRSRRSPFASAALCAAASAALLGASQARAGDPNASTFTLTLIPDTQNYTVKPSAMNYFYDQLDWVAANASSQNIAFTYGLGDIVQDGVPFGPQNNTAPFATILTEAPNGNIATGPNDTRQNGAVQITTLDPVGSANGNPNYMAEWGRGDDAYSMLDRANVPYYAGIGRHDYWHWGIKNTPQLFNHYFGAQRYAGQSALVTGNPVTSGGDMTASGLDTYSYFRAGGYKFLSITLQFDPDATDIAWAQKVVNDNKGLPTIVFTADALDPNVAGFRNAAGQNVWNNLINNNKQIFMLLAGHITTTVNFSSNDAAGEPVEQILTDYETNQYGTAQGFQKNYFEGGGFLRNLQFNMATNTVSATTFSPSIQKAGDPKTTLTTGSGATAEAFSFSLGDFTTRFGAAPYLPGNNFAWDPAKTGTNTGGGSGTWDQATTTNWNGSAGDGTWSSAQVADTAVFGGTAGTVTVAAGGVSAGKLTFNTSGYTVTGGTLTATGAATIDTTHGNATINSVVAGTNGLVATGGKLTLGGANTFTGGLAVQGGGTVSFTADNNLGGTGQPIALDSGTLSYNGNISGGLTETRDFNILGGGATFDVPNPGPSSGTTNGKLIINGDGLLSGTSSITKTGPGWLTVYGDNSATYSGSVNVNGGVVEVGNVNSFGGGNLTVNNGGELALNVTTPLPNAITMNAGSTLGADFFNTTATGTFSGPITAAGNFNVRLGNFYDPHSQKVSFTGNLSGPGTITTVGPFGTTPLNPASQVLTLTGNNSGFTGGFVIKTGTVVAGLTANNPLGSGGITLAGGKLALQGQLAPTGPAAAIAPVATSGFTADTINGLFDNQTTVGMDGTFSFFQTGYEPVSGFNYNTQLTKGLPGQNLTSTTANSVYQAQGQTVNTPFALQSFTGKNTLQIGEGKSASLVLNSGGSFTNLAVLATSTFGADETPKLTINFTDGTSVTTAYKAYDWSIGTDAAKQGASIFGASGINRYSPTSSPGWDQRAFGMYETDIDLTNINGVDYSGKVVSSLNFAATTFDTQNRGMTDVFAVSGASRALATSASQSYLNNVSVTSDSGIDVSGSLSAALGTLAVGSAKLSVTSADATANPYSLSFGSASVTGNATIDVAASTGGGAGTVSLGALTGAGSLTKSNTGTLKLTGTTNSIGGSFNVNAGSVVATGTSTTTGGLSIAAGAKFDLTSGSFDIHYGIGANPDATIRGYLLTGYNGGTWAGAGLTSSVAASDTVHHAVGYADGADNVVAGLAAGDELVKYTFAGDANLDGKVDVSDLGILATNYGHLSGTKWDQGDFTYDGGVDVSDLGVLATNYGAGTGVTGAAAAAMFQSDLKLVEAEDPAFAAAVGVPEPTGLCLLALAAGATLSRRRKRT